MNVYGAGSLVKVEWSFTDEDDNAIDPSAVYLDVKNPNDSDTTWIYGVGSVIVRDSTGTYYSNIDTIGLVGLWVCEAYSTGTAQAHSKEWEFRTE